MALSAYRRGSGKPRLSHVGEVKNSRRRFRSPLAWLLAQKPRVVPIPGMDKVEYIDDNLKFLDVELTAEDLREIDEQMSRINLQGARLNEGLLSMSEK